MSQKQNQVLGFANVLAMLWRKKILLLKFVLSAIPLGLLIAFTTPKKWQSSIRLVTEEKETGFVSILSGSLGNLADFTGVSLPGAEMEKGLDPQIYPQLINTPVFLEELSSTSFYFESLGKKLTLYEFFEGHHRTSLTKKILTAPLRLRRLLSSGGGQEVVLAPDTREHLKFTEKELEVFNKLSNSISIRVDKKTGIVDIWVEMQDPVVCADICQFVTDYIVRYVSDYKIEKEKRNLEFIANLLNEKKLEYQNSQKELSNFLDKNQNLSSEVAKLEIENLTAKRYLAYSVYTFLANKYEDAKISVQKKIPVMKVIKPVVIPDKRFTPKRGRIMITICLVGFIVGVLYVVLLQLVLELLRKVKLTYDDI